MGNNKLKTKIDSRKKTNSNTKTKNDDGNGALFIPAGVLMGFGFGFLFGNVPAGMFLGLGAGFTAFAITTILQYSCKNVMKMSDLSKQNKSCNCELGDKGCSGIIYFLGVIGAIVYYISTATGFWIGFLGVLKALIWPAFLVFELLKFLGV
jgi:hypothetical protein